jgi:flagellar biosynthetic protein FliR
MIPAGFAGLEAQLWLWMVAMIRPGAAFLAAPVFGAAFVPVQLRLVIALAIGIPALGAVNFVLPPEGLASIAGFMLVGGEVLAGLALGFAGMVDPASGQHNPMLGQFLTILATFLFLAIGGHLALAATIVESYRALPPGDAWLGADSIRQLVFFGGVLFAAGLSIALPVGFAIILVQIVMAVLARSAPQLNLFSVGLPAALLAGIILLAIAAPVMGDGIVGVLQQGLDQARRLAIGG